MRLRPQLSPRRVRRLAPRLEELEPRNLLTGPTPGVSFYETLDQAQDLSVLAPAAGSANVGDASVGLTLAAGDYYVGVGGAGNHYYYPYLAGSGYAGHTGDYQLSLNATDLPANPGDGPVVLRFDPSANTTLA